MWLFFKFSLRHTFEIWAKYVLYHLVMKLSLRHTFQIWAVYCKVVFLIFWLRSSSFLGEVTFIFWVRSSSVFGWSHLQFYVRSWYNDTQTHIHNDTQAHIYTMIHIDIDYVEKVVANHTKNTLCGEKLKYIFLCEENSLSDKHLSKICSVSSMNDRTAIL